ncbi:MAG TPA: hypothetical protein PKK26_10800 [Candidatus Wallbacteria bacterium]|nr:hypothetical protein [Candidatus Wallbacteria bacterium]
MDHETVCVVCSASAEKISRLLESFDRQSTSSGHSLHISTYRGLEKYPAFDFSGNYSYVVFVREGTELYGEDFVERITAPLKKDPGIKFVIPSTVIHQDAPYYQLDLSVSEKNYGIPLCNVITGFSPEKYGVFAVHNVLALAMRYQMFLEIQQGNDFILNPVDFSILPALMRRYPGSSSVASQCGVYLPKFTNFIELWKLFYCHGKMNAWFNYNCGKFKAGMDEKVHSFYTLAYYTGYFRKYAGLFFRGADTAKAIN